MSHVPVLFEECLAALRLERGGLIVDGTLGGGGHTEGILQRSAATVIGIDRDADAIERCRERLAPYEGRVTFVRDDFKNISDIAKQLGISGIDGALLDLGVSSFQLDEAERGFSYGKEAPLDMRMDRSQAKDARTVVNEYERDELARIFREYGEEKFAGRVAGNICEARRQRPIETTTELAEIVKNAIPAATRRTGPHPARRTFQAIRIEVNDELRGLKEAVDSYIELLNPGGRLLVITFHSLEDRIVKLAMRTAQEPCVCPKDFPVCVCGRKSKGKVVTRKPIAPSEAELSENARSRSAKLRVFEKLAETDR